MVEEFKHFLKTTPTVKVRTFKNGVLYFDRAVMNGMGYLVRGKRIFKIPVTLSVLNEQELPIK